MEIVWFTWGAVGNLLHSGSFLSRSAPDGHQNKQLFFPVSFYRDPKILADPVQIVLFQGVFVGLQPWQKSKWGVCCLPGLCGGSEGTSAWKATSSSFLFFYLRFDSETVRPTCLEPEVNPAAASGGICCTEFKVKPHDQSGANKSYRCRSLISRFSIGSGPGAALTPG